MDLALRQDFTIAGYIFYASCEAIAKAGRFLMLSKIDPTVVKDMRIESFQDIDTLMAQLDLRGKHVAVIPYAGYVLPQSEAIYKRLNDEFVL